MSLLDSLFPAWMLVLGDALVFLIIGLPAYLLIRLFTSPDTPVGSALRMAGWVVPCLVALQFRGHYGPAFRLALMQPEHRPARQFADRIESSPEIRAYREGGIDFAWISEKGGLNRPSFQATVVANKGLLRLSDRELMQRNEILARALEDKAVCLNARGWEFVERAIWDLPPNVQETWFDLNFRAILAEVRGTAPVRNADPASVEAFAEIVRQIKAVKEPVTVIGASMPSTLGSDCLKMQRLYAAVVADTRRPGLDRSLAAKAPNPAGALP
jgi:hypothetical protein